MQTRHLCPDQHSSSSLSDILHLNRASAPTSHQRQPPYLRVDNCSTGGSASYRVRLASRSAEFTIQGTSAPGKTRECGDTLPAIYRGATPPHSRRISTPSPLKQLDPLRATRFLTSTPLTTEEIQPALICAHSPPKSGKNSAPPSPNPLLTHPYTHPLFFFFMLLLRFSLLNCLLAFYLYTFSFSFLSLALPDFFLSPPYFKGNTPSCAVVERGVKLPALQVCSLQRTQKKADSVKHLLPPAHPPPTLTATRSP